MLIKDVMTHQVETVGRNDDLLMLDELMRSRHLRHLPVIEDGKIVGIVTQRDLFKAAMSSAMGYGEKAQHQFLHSVRVKEIMMYPVTTVTPETELQEAVRMIMEKGIGCLPVVEGTKLVGMVTKTNLLRYLHSVAD
jgi:CBS domain-containing protein